jgi:hypothetical protein
MRSAQRRCAHLSEGHCIARGKTSFRARVVLQRHEMQRDSLSSPAIGTVVAEQTRAFDNRFVRRRTESWQQGSNPGRIASLVVNSLFKGIL